MTHDTDGGKYVRYFPQIYDAHCLLSWALATEDVVWEVERIIGWLFDNPRASSWP